MKHSMLSNMQRISLKHVLCTVALLALGGGILHANVATTNPASAETNPYATIADRNPFALKPPPPPPAPPEQTAPPVPMAKVTLTGLLNTFGEPRVLLEIVEDGAKGGGTPQKPVLREGERMGAVEVLAIDVVKNSVLLRNSGVETNITFPVAKAGPVPGGPGVPGAPPTYTPPPALQNPAVPQPQNPQASAGPTIISPGGANPANGAGGGVTLMGNNAATPTAGVPGALGASADGGMRTIPSRPLRTDAAAGGLPPMTKEQADLLMEVNRLRGGPPSPPTSLTPMMQAEEAAQHQQPNANPAYPRLPYRTPPPVPGRQ